MKSLALRRRQFLKALGLTGAFLPLLPEAQPRAAGKFPKRFVTWLWPNGVSDEYWPAVPGPLTLTETLNPLEPHKKDILVVDNMMIKVMLDQFKNYGGHPSQNWILTGAFANPGKYGGEDLAVGNSISIDVWIAEQQAKLGIAPRFKTLALGVDNREEHNLAYKYFSFNGPAVGGRPNAPTVDDDVQKLYMKLFGDGSTGQNGDLARVLARRKSVLDYTGRALERFGRDVGSESKQVIDLHLQSIRDIERQVQMLPADGGGKAPTIDPTINSYDKKQYDKIGKAQLDLTVAALATGQTNVVSLAWSNGHNNSWVFYWLGDDFTQKISGGFNSTLGHHDIAHAGGSATGSSLNARRKRAVDQWFHGQLAYLIAELKKRAIFDDTLIYFTNNMGNGAGHGVRRTPMILAGGGGYFSTGRYVKPSGDKAHNYLLVSIAQCMGFNVDTFGSKDYVGPLAGLTA